MSSKTYLLRLLTVIFAMQWLVIVGGVGLCAFAPSRDGKGVRDHCPNLGSRIENLFMMSTATVLSLLTDIRDQK